ncbi:LysR family transcriptional regulator [Clostridium sp. AM58-1XD]|uniref:LysR family transcriptional regulator n=1 Tax=Clostridium sp. AM58-1XD TaxID=2292307 RepID=UPI000E483059|nr:LysR family transcriptional regulator [Clostridium sp. AM58-1XD]RGY95439.1 LysR family transcriptional regulator [Clostridium sp. AM58-1XD]
MNIRQLQIFEVVCTEKNVTRAAEKLYMTQPAVSHVIAELEEETGCRLFDRISRRLYLNETGKRFLGKTKQLLELFEELSEGFSESEEFSPVTIGTAITAANFWLPELLRDFSERWKNTPVKIEVERTSDVEQKLLDCQADVGLLEGKVKSRQLEYVVFSGYHISAFAVPEMGKKCSMTTGELSESRLLLREKGSAIRDSFDYAMAAAGFEAVPAMESVNSQALIQAARSGFGIALLPDILVKREEEAGELKKIHVEGLEIFNEISIAWHREKELTSPLKWLVERLKNKSGLSKTY